MKDSHCKYIKSFRAEGLLSPEKATDTTQLQICQETAQVSSTSAAANMQTMAMQTCS